MDQMEKNRHHDPVMKLYQEDQKAIQQYAQNPQGTFQYASKKSLARNYRDLDIRNATYQGTAPFGPMQAAYDFTAERCSIIDDDSIAEGLSLTAVMGNLCRSALLAKTVGCDQYMAITDLLTAGFQLRKEKNPNQEIHEKLQQDGNRALGEVYQLQLESMDKQYGQKLCKLSAYDYIKAMPAIADDFACIKDMNKFFASRPLSEKMTAKLQFYTDAIVLLEEQATALASMEISTVTVKGALTTQAKNLHNRRMAEVLTKAKTAKALTADLARPPLSTHLADLNQRKEAGKNAHFNYIATQRRDMEVSDRETAALEDIQQKTNDYQGMLLAKRIADQENLSEAERARAARSVAAYHRKPNAITEEEFIRLSAEKNHLLNFTLTGTTDVTEENAEELLKKEINAILHINRFLTNASDESLMEDATAIQREALRCKTQVNMLEHCFLSDYASEIRNNKPAQIENYARKKALADSFSAFRAVSNHPDTVVWSCEKILENRFDHIARYGSFQGNKIQEKANPLVIGHGMKFLQEQEKAPMSFAQAKEQTYIKVGLLNYPPSEDTIPLEKVEKNLLICKTIAKYKADCPDLYRLGQSYGDYVACEAMLSVQESMKLAYEMTLKRFGLSSRNQETMETIERQWKTAVSNYNDAVIAAHSITLPLSRNHHHGDLALGVNLNAVQNRTEAVKQAPRYRENAAIKEHLSYYRIGSLVTTDIQDTMNRDLDDVDCLLNQNPQSKTLEPETVIAAAKMIHRFSHSYKAVLDNVTKDRAYSDSTLVNNRDALENCAIMGQSLRDLMNHGNILEKLDESFSGTLLEELKYDEIQNFPTQLSNILTLSTYANALQLRQCVQFDAQVQVSRVNTTEGEHPVASLKDISYTMRAMFSTTHDVVERIRLKHKEAGREEEMNASQMSARVQARVQRELMANARRSNWYSPINAMTWLGSRLGAPLQFLSWMLHEPRTAHHGSSRFEESHTLYQRKMEGLSVHTTRTLDNENYAPAVPLKKHYNCEVKESVSRYLKDAKEMLEAPTNAQDFLTAEFDQAITALKDYSGMVTIVNSDTTEMEMAFLDRFNLMSEDYLTIYDTEEAPYFQQRCTFLKTIAALFRDKLHGTLSSTMSPEELAEIEKHTTAYVEDTCYGANMDQSNIKDIPLFLHQPSIQDVRQSSIGDCWLVSAIGSVAKTNPEYIRSMFHDCGDGNVLVRLFAADNQTTGQQTSTSMEFFQKDVTMTPVYFKLRKHYETGWGNASDCAWVQLLEKAYALGGFNTRNVMEVRGNKLYNVADELTMGSTINAVSHICGTKPKNLRPTEGVSEVDFLGQRFCSHITRGLEKKAMETAISFFMQFSFNRAMQPAQAQQTATWADARQFILDNRADFASLLRSETREIPPEEIESLMTPILSKLDANFAKMLAGESILKTATGQAIPLETEMMEQAHYFQKAREGDLTRYDKKANAFYHRCKSVIDEGGSVSLAYPHCVSIIDTKEHDGKLFLLIRDPFNIYNTVYATKNGQRTKTSDGLLAVFTQRTLNRHLADQEEEIIRTGYRGTSWLEVDDLMSVMTSAHQVAPHMLRAN